jgi:hypothetical protein
LDLGFPCELEGTWLVWIKQDLYLNFLVFVVYMGLYSDTQTDTAHACDEL